MGWCDSNRLEMPPPCKRTCHTWLHAVEILALQQAKDWLSVCTERLMKARPYRLLLISLSALTLAAGAAEPIALHPPTA